MHVGTNNSEKEVSTGGWSRHLKGTRIGQNVLSGILPVTEAGVRSKGTEGGWRSTHKYIRYVWRREYVVKLCGK